MKKNKFKQHHLVFALAKTLLVIDSLSATFITCCDTSVIISIADGFVESAVNQ